MTTSTSTVTSDDHAVPTVQLVNCRHGFGEARMPIVLAHDIKLGQFFTLFFIVMRKIEAQLITAIREVLADSNFVGQYWKSGNTCVFQWKENGPNGRRWIEVILHNTVIALIEPDAVRINLYTCGFRTSVTKSRINAVLSDLSDGFKVFQKNNQWLYSRRSWDTSEPFYEGICVGLAV
jgi:hypothetical protein